MTNDPIAPGSISRRRFLGTTLAALSSGIASKKGLASGAGLGAEPEVGRIPTLDELATEWLDCSQLAHMPSLHNFHEMAACAPDLVGVNFFPGGQLYEDSGPRWYIYNALPLCRLLIDGGQYDSSSCRWYAYQAERRAKAGDLGGTLHQPAGDGGHDRSLASQVYQYRIGGEELSYRRGR